MPQTRKLTTSQPVRNTKPPRSSANIADNQLQDFGYRPAANKRNMVNVGPLERFISILAGSSLIGVGAERRNWKGVVLGLLGAGLVRRGWTGYCSGYALMGINHTDGKSTSSIRSKAGVKIERSVTINRSPQDLYTFWRDLENLPCVMSHLKEVAVHDQLRSHWVAAGPLGKEVEWEAEIVNERENEMISWKSLPESEIETAGSVRFTALPFDRGTQVTISLQYKPPGGRFIAKVASLFGQDMESRLIDDIYNFKRMMETREVPTTAGQPSGRN
jgi:uncharacterized membrane protein